MNVSNYDVVWPTPSADASGSMPLGNGEIGLNVWVEPSGDLCFYIGRTDAWGEFGQLYKVGRIRVALTSEGQALLKGENFRWRLDLLTGSIHVSTERGCARIWVDANHPQVNITADGSQPITGSVAVEIWRTERRLLEDKQERHSLHVGAPYPVYHDKDHLASLEGDQIAWYHHNESSSWKACLEQQGLENLTSELDDPLLHRTFGGVVRGPGLRRESDARLVSAEPATSFSASVTLLTEICPQPTDWIDHACALADQTPTPRDETAWDAHSLWWAEFWNRSWIEADGCEAARKVSQGYTLQRFMNACAGRGAFPIKFNGSIFTVPWGYWRGENLDADYRRWGPGYWHQNTRLPYWSMLLTGDYEMMLPYFRMYRDALRLATERCRQGLGLDAAFFLETQYFWGAYLEHNYGYEREDDLPSHLPVNGYIKRHHSSGLEVVYHALLLFRATRDEAFLTETILPLAEAVIDYYAQAFPRKDGQLHIAPAQVIEQWWEAENPLPEIAGLRACLDALLQLPSDAYSTQRREGWETLLSELPEIPTQEIDGKRKFAPAAWWKDEPKNQENPELYAIFPYHHCNLDSDDLEVGHQSFCDRKYWHDQGWAQDGMQAALLGRTGDAQYSVTARLTTPSAFARFPSFWGPSFDWIPDQDQGGSAAHAFQLMCLQTIDLRLHVLPAWPEDWSVDFKLNAIGRATVQGSYKPGEGLTFEVTGPEAGQFETIAHR